MQDFEKVEFAKVYASATAKRIGIGDLLAEGTVRFAEKLGRLPAGFDVWLRLTAWEYMDHLSMSGVEWAYGHLMDSRDINNHDMSLGPKEKMTCEEFVKLIAERTEPFNTYRKPSESRRNKRLQASTRKVIYLTSGKSFTRCRISVKLYSITAPR